MVPMFLVIGLGNTLRRDDGAGWIFAQSLVDALQDAGVHAALILQQQLTPEIAENAAEQGATSIVFVDASVVAEAVTLTEVSEHEEVAPISHQLAPTTILAIARRLYGTQVFGWLVQLPAHDLGHGEGLSRYAASNLEHVNIVAAKLLAEASPDRSDWAALPRQFLGSQQPPNRSKPSCDARGSCCTLPMERGG